MEIAAADLEDYWNHITLNWSTLDHKQQDVIGEAELLTGRKTTTRR